MKHAILPIAAAATLLLAACGKNDDGVMSPEPAPPVEQTTPADTPPEPAPPVDDTMTPPPSDEAMPPADTTMPPPADTPADPENPDAPTDSTAPPAG